MTQQAAAPPSAGEPSPAVRPGTEVGSSRGGTLRAVTPFAVGVLVAFAVVAVLSFGPDTLVGDRDGTADAKAGDCLAELPEVTGAEQKTVDDPRIVPCTSTRAAYAVVGRVEDPVATKTRTAEACEPYFRVGDDGYVFSVGGDREGHLLCLVRR